MSAALTPYEETAPPAQTDAGGDEYESSVVALVELREAYTRGAIDQIRLRERVLELETGLKEFRRSRARTVLDLNYPPVTFFGIEEAEPEDRKPRGAKSIFHLHTRPRAMARQTWPRDVIRAFAAAPLVESKKEQ